MRYIIISLLMLASTSCSHQEDGPEEPYWWQFNAKLTLDEADLQCKAAIAQADKEFQGYGWYVNCMRYRGWQLSGGPSEG
jgi:hypothetical protein